MGAAGAQRRRHGVTALLWLLLAARCGAVAATGACAAQLDASGPYDKSNTNFTFDVLAAADVNVTAFAVRLLSASRAQATVTVRFKEESWAANTLAWQPVAAARDGWLQGVARFTLSQPLRAGVQSAFVLECSSNNIRYNFQPYLAGVQTAAVTDGTLSILPGTSNGRVRYFAGFVGYTLNTPACASISAPFPPPSPPPSTFTLPALPAGSVYVYSEADLLAAIANPAVTDVVLAASFKLSGTPVTIPSTSTLLSISGNAASCALAAVGSPPPFDYDYSSDVAPVYSPLSSAVCTIDGATMSQILVVETESLALSNLQLINGWTGFWSYGGGENGGAVFMSDAATAATCTSLLEVNGCVFAGDGAYEAGARVRALVQYGFSQQMEQPKCNPLKITERDISDEHVNALYTELFRRASDFRKHATRELRFTRQELQSNHREEGIAEADEAPSPRASEADPPAAKSGGDGDALDSKPLAAAPTDIDFTLRTRQSLSSRLVSAAKRSAKTFFVHAVSTLSGNEAPHIAASQVHELSRDFKLQELLSWSQVHLHAPPMRWAHHEIVDCIEHLYAHLFCEHWCVAGASTAQRRHN